MKVPSQVCAVCVAIAIALGTSTLFAQSEINTVGRRLVSRTNPVYPQLIRGMNLSGTVKLTVTVASNGTAKSIEVKGGNPLLAAAAQNAVHEWKWEKLDHETTELVEVHFNP